MHTLTFTFKGGTYLNFLWYFQQFALGFFPLRFTCKNKILLVSMAFFVLHIIVIPTWVTLAIFKYYINSSKKILDVADWFLEGKITIINHKEHILFIVCSFHKVSSCKEKTHFLPVLARIFQNWEAKLAMPNADVAK